MPGARGSPGGVGELPLQTASPLPFEGGCRGPPERPEGREALEGWVPHVLRSPSSDSGGCVTCDLSSHPQAPLHQEFRPLVAPEVKHAKVAGSDVGEPAGIWPLQEGLQKELEACMSPGERVRDGGGGGGCIPSRHPADALGGSLSCSPWARGAVTIQAASTCWGLLPLSSTVRGSL